mmetsp:Transcript_35251/g.62288  ORF Transcript_35251/g.62288 Transcript_35251/m.62288 type:complete len:133 (+) Transcript_35251:109-507(+)
MVRTSPGESSVVVAVMLATLCISPCAVVSALEVKSLTNGTQHQNVGAIGQPSRHGQTRTRFEAKPKEMKVVDKSNRLMPSPSEITNNIELHVTGSYSAPPEAGPGDQEWLQAMLAAEQTAEDRWVKKAIGVK